MSPRPQSIARTVALAALLIALGCGRPPEPKIDTVYQGLSEDLPRLELAILEGRRVLIDPGHGGHFRGTLGQNGLEEARVNLGVSLYLWGLLKEAGAEAILTRSAEKDFLSETDSTLAGELGARVALVDSLKPDILVSIHHNAQNDRDPEKNATETYYKFGDRASRDLAFAVHRHLMRNLGTAEGEIRPGNYFILRNIDIPAILGEGSYLTHPGVEDKLQLSDKQRLEAEAYFLGILEYFSRGTPILETLSPLDTTLADIPTLRFSVSDRGGIGVDPASIDLTVNGRHVDARLEGDGTTVSYPLPWNSSNGRYSVSLGVRNLLGNSSSSQRIDFDLDLPPHTATFDIEPAVLPRTGGTLRVRARLLDRRGLSIADGTPLAVTTTENSRPDTTAVENGFVEFPVVIGSDKTQVTVSVSTREHTFTRVIDSGQGAFGAFEVVAIVDVVSGEPIIDAAVFASDSLVANGSASGRYFLPESADHSLIRAPGFRPVRMDESLLDTLFMTPWYDGVLLGRRFVLDPEGGFGVEPGMGQLGLSGPFVNLQVARYLAEYLTAAGASVQLTRKSEVTLSGRDVVSLTNGFRADRYIEIRHRAAVEDSGGTVHTFFFPGSRTGLAMSTVVQSAAAQLLGLEVSPPRDVVTFPLQQTACPAIVVEYPSISSLEEELRLSEPWYQRKQAYGVFVGILRHYGVEDSTLLTVAIEDDERANWLVTVDDTWNLLSDPSGQATFFALPRNRSLDVGLMRSIHRTNIPVPASAFSGADTIRISPIAPDRTAQ